jgi:ribosome biogenesis GTPase
MAKKKKVRVEMRKNRQHPPRDHGWTRGFHDHGYEEQTPLLGERVKAKGDLSRRRTIIQDEHQAPTEGQAPAEMPAADPEATLPGRVLRVDRRHSVVETEDGRQFRCVVRQVLRSLTTDERRIVTTGDHVWLRPVSDDEGLIERVESRHGVLTRASRGRKHVLVSNVDQVVIVVSLVEPALKPHLIDRYLASAEQGGIRAVICLNKADLIDPEDYQSDVGFYSQLGVPALLTSAATGLGIDRLKAHLRGRQTVFSGQSGVGKSSLLNAVQPGLGLRVREVSDVNQKGKHTTTSTQMLKLDLGGWVFDTPGIRQFELWDIISEEVEGFFAEFRPWVPLCAFPDCTHTHEERCAVKRAVLRRQLSASRYTSYVGMFTGAGE